MARPVTISDETILDAARALFTAKGPRTTTAEIAARAGVSEGILFKRFGSKAALHRAAMSTGMVTTWIQDETRAQSPLRTQKDFSQFIRWHMGVMREVVPMVVMGWSSRSKEEVPPSLTGPRPAPLVAIHTLAEKLQAEMDAGHLAQRNAEGVARMLIGTIWYFVFLELVLNKKGGGFDEDTLVEELARAVFTYVAPAQGPRTKRLARR